MAWRTIIRTAMGALALAAAATSSTMAQQSSPDYVSTWDKIRKNNKITVACISDPPYAAYDPTTRTWQGFHIEIIKSLAKSLSVNWACQESSWSHLALDIQSGKADLAFSVQATPERALIIDFVGPMYNQGFSLVLRRGLTPSDNWSTYNKPDFRISAVLGSANDNVIDMVTPRATKVALPSGGEPAMAVASGRADAFLSSAITGPFAVMKNPNLGQLIIPEPVVSFPAYIAVRLEPDRRFGSYLRWWAEWNRYQGIFEKMAKSAMIEAGVPEASLPGNMQLH